MRRAWLPVLILAPIAGAVMAQTEVRTYRVMGDAIPESLTKTPGDARRGQAIVANRTIGLCVLCHRVPGVGKHFYGDLATDLAGAGNRWNAGQLRLRIVDASRLKRDSIMPPYYRVDGLQRVAQAYRGKPILSAAQIEDIVAYLETLKD